MAAKNEAKDKTAEMIAEYNAGTSINDIADKYGCTSHEVELIVTNVKQKDK